MTLQEALLCLVSSEHNSGHFFTSIGQNYLFMTLVHSLSCIAVGEAYLFLTHTDEHSQRLIRFGVFLIRRIAK